MQRINSELCHLTNEEGRTLSNSLKKVATKNSEFLAQTTRKLGPLEECQEKLQHIANLPESAIYPHVMQSLQFQRDDKGGGAPGPDGDMVAFPEYDASEPPRDHKKAFTLFCYATRREVKASLDPASRKNKVRRGVVVL